MSNKTNHRFALAMTKLEYTDKEAHSAITRKLADTRGYITSLRQRATAAEEELRITREELTRVTRGDSPCR